MDIHQFLELFVGRWRSQRSDHQFGEGNGSDARSLIEITALELDDPELIAICEKHDVDPNLAIHPMKFSWEEESLSNNKPKGNVLFVPIPNDVATHQKGSILSGQNKGLYELASDESLAIQTLTAQGAIEERIWYGNPNLRFRVATLLQKNNSHDPRVQRSTVYSEIRSAMPRA